MKVEKYLYRYLGTNWNMMRSILAPLKKALVLLVTVLLCAGCATYLPSIGSNPWQVVALPVDSTLADVAFTGNPQHGWLVGNNSTLLETIDGGKTWQQRILDLEGQKYRFTSVSFSGNEGWVVGQPAILLHTEDGGRSWLQVPLSEKLPGSPNIVAALGSNAAEMTTDIGAIYRTADSGKTWKAMVQEALGVMRNIARSPDGKYVAVSARGNFYSVWKPGQVSWEQHNRESSRRLQNMGFGKDGRLWMLERGGLVQFGDANDLDSWEEPINPEFSTSWGLLDLAYRTPDEMWIAGGSGNLICSFDGGKTWQKDREVEDVPSNLYKVVFLSQDQGFVLGQDGVLLRYEGSTQPA